jgi:hypothetical protein
MTRTRWLVAAAVAGIAVFGLSFVNAWILHDRELRGEGYRHVQVVLSAWRGVAMPVLTIGTVAALAGGIWALVLHRRPGLPDWPLLAAGVVAVGMVAGSAWPVAQDTHASSVDLSPAILLPIGLVLTGIVLAAGVAVTRRARRWLPATAAAVIVLAAVGAGGRWAVLQAAEGDGRHWSDGSYTRVATGGEPTETLVIADGRFSIGERWSGTWEWSGWTVVLDNDPACPESRGAYHAHGEGEANLRFVRVVDTCADGARGADLETGIWIREP